MEDPSKLSNFSDGPYVFISNNRLIEKKILNGEVTSRVLKPSSYDTIFTPQKSRYENVENIAAAIFSTFSYLDFWGVNMVS